jgi:hypothetical protein
MEMKLFASIWELSDNSSYLDNMPRLTELTEELIQLYEGQGRLSEDPFLPSRVRILDLPEDRINALVKDKVCLVTGGLGCVGTALIKELVRFDPKLIVILDIIDQDAAIYPIPKDDRIVFEKGCIVDYSRVTSIFNTYGPQIVFHTAAQRNPGLAESEINLSVKTNVLGTWNILSAIKDTSSVERFVFSSTGKASRYYTEEVYAATKKICEMLVDYFSVVCPQKFFSMVRFTHIVDNSLMDLELAKTAKESPYVAIHSPGKFVTAQNVKEAAYLMLNGLLYAESGKSNFLMVRHLEWPVESLEVALYYIKLYKRNIPIVFVGNPKGYGEKFFRGQLDWKNPGDLNLLINVYECATKRISESEDVIISSIIPYEGSVLLKLIKSLQKETSESETKAILIDGLRDIFVGSLEKVDKKLTYDILEWGIDPKFLAADNLKVEDFGIMVPLMVESLVNSTYFDKLKLGLNRANSF